MKLFLLRSIIGAIYFAFVFLSDSEKGQWSFGSLATPLLIIIVPYALVNCFCNILLREKRMSAFLEKQSELIDFFKKEFYAILAYFMGYTAAKIIAAF